MTGSSMTLLIVIIGLMFAAGALLRAISALWDLIAELLVALFANLRALAVIALLIACFVVVALIGGPTAGGGPS